MLVFRIFALPFLLHSVLPTFLVSNLIQSNSFNTTMYNSPCMHAHFRFLVKINDAPRMLSTTFLIFHSEDLQSGISFWECVLKNILNKKLNPIRVLFRKRKRIFDSCMLEIEISYFIFNRYVTARLLKKQMNWNKMKWPAWHAPHYAVLTQCTTVR